MVAIADLGTARERAGIAALGPTGTARWPALIAAPQRVTPQWLAGKPLIFNDTSTRLYKQTMEWFGAAGIVPRVRIELNYNEAMKSLAAAGYGAAILPLGRCWTGPRAACSKS
jgi:DNA-binding transcriptional LysR family regulator